MSFFLRAFQKQSSPFGVVGVRGWGKGGETRAFTSTTSYRRRLVWGLVVLIPVAGGIGLAFAKSRTATPSDISLQKKDGVMRVVILGCGWGGVSLMNNYKPHENVEVVCVSSTNYFLMTPLLPSATVGW
jgi:hypothetical protein